MKKLLTSMIILIYVMQISFIIGIVFGLTSKDLIQENIMVKIFFASGAFIAFVVFNLCVAIFIIGSINIVKNNLCDFKFIMIIKLLLIPFYIVNFIIWFLIVVASLNPWLFLSVFITIPFAVIFTYIIMLSTSYNDITSLINKSKNKQIKISDYKVPLVFMFIFIFDVIGSALLAFDKKLNEQ